MAGCGSGWIVGSRRPGPARDKTAHFRRKFGRQAVSTLTLLNLPRRVPSLIEACFSVRAMTGGFPRQAQPSSPPIALQESPSAFPFPTLAPPTTEAPFDPMVAPSDLKSDQPQTGANVWRRTSTGSTSSASSSSRPSSVVSLHGMFATSSSHPSLDTLQPQPELSASSSDEGHRISQPPTILKSFDPNIAYRSSAYSPTSPTTPTIREPLEMEYSEGTHLKGVAGKMSAAERRKRKANIGQG